VSMMRRVPFEAGSWGKPSFRGRGPGSPTKPRVGRFRSITCRPGPCGRRGAAGMIQTRKMSDAVIRKARDTDIPAIASLWFEMMNYHLARDRRFAIAHDASTIF